MKKYISPLFLFCALLSVSADPSYNTGAASFLKGQPVMLDRLKKGKYLLEQGTEEEYIEVYPDGTLKFFGFDYASLCSDDSSDMSEEVRNYIERMIKLFNSRSRYAMNEYMPYIRLSGIDSDKADNGIAGLTYKDENTLVFDESMGYVYHYQDQTAV